MITYDDKTGVMKFTGKDDVCVRKYMKEHKLTYRDVVYLALMNGMAEGYFDKKEEGLDSKQVHLRGPQKDMAVVATKKASSKGVRK